MKNRTYIVRLNQIHGLIDQSTHRAESGTYRTLTGIFITKDRCIRVIDSRGHFFAYQKLTPESYFDVFLEGEWHDKYSVETREIMNRHWAEDNL